MKSGNLNFLEPSAPLQACNGTFTFTLFVNKMFRHQIINTYRVKKCKSFSVEASKEVTGPPESAPSLKNRPGLHGQMALRAMLAVA
jgi:hypothetical protein